MNPLISLRLMDHHLNPELLEQLLDVLKRQPGSTDEVWLCSEYGFPPLDKIQRNGDAMLTAAARFRELGIMASLQISNSLGHGDYLKNMDFGGVAWQCVVGPNGQKNPYANCPTDRAFLQYIRESTRLYCRFQPSILWVDDDLRMHNHLPVNHGCFCDGCMAIFNAKHDSDFSREDLWTAINGDDSIWRERWIAFNGERLSNVTRAIMAGCLSVSPNTVGAFQHCGSSDTLYSGRTWHSVYDVMKEMTGKAPMARPGGGFYHDGAPRDMLHKLLYLDYQLKTLPEYIQYVRPEVENLPHLAAMGKSVHGTCVESTMYLAYGMNGLSYATLMLDNESPYEHERMLSRFSAWRPYWLKLIQANEGTHSTGMTIPRGTQYLKQERNGRTREMFWDSPNTGSIPPMLITGLPIHWENGYAQPFLLNPELARSLSVSELESIFSKGAMVCAQTLKVLEERGLGRFAGILAEAPEQAPAAERFADTPYTAGDLGIRKGSSFNGCTVSGADAMCLKALPDIAETTVVSEYITHDGRVLGVSSMVVKNALGGYTTALGYLPWNNQVNTIRREAYLQMAAKLFGGALPARVEEAWPVVVVPRADAEGRVKAVTLLNASIDETAALTLRVAHPAGQRALLMRPERGDSPLSIREDAVALPPLPAWGVATIVFHGERGCLT